MRQLTLLIIALATAAPTLAAERICIPDPNSKGWLCGTEDELADVQPRSVDRRDRSTPAAPPAYLLDPNRAAQLQYQNPATLPPAGPPAVQGPAPIAQPSDATSGASQAPVRNVFSRSPAPIAPSQGVPASLTPPPPAPATAPIPPVRAAAASPRPVAAPATNTPPVQAPPPASPPVAQPPRSPAPSAAQTSASNIAKMSALTDTAPETPADTSSAEDAKPTSTATVTASATVATQPASAPEAAASAPTATASTRQTAAERVAPAKPAVATTEAATVSPPQPPAKAPLTAPAPAPVASTAPPARTPATPPAAPEAIRPSAAPVQRDGSSASAASMQTQTFAGWGEREYTIQLRAGDSPDDYSAVAGGSGLAVDSFHKVRLQQPDRTWWLLCFGRYPNLQAAKQALDNLPAHLRGPGVWPRRVGPLQTEISR